MNIFQPSLRILAKYSVPGIALHAFGPSIVHRFRDARTRVPYRSTKSFLSEGEVLFILAYMNWWMVGHNLAGTPRARIGPKK